MNDKDIQQLILERMEAAEQRANELKACPYDGVLGSPPEWVPELIRGLFEQKRDIMLMEWGYSPEKAREWLDRYSSENEDDCSAPGTYPSGKALDYVFFMETIGFLAYLRWCVSLGEDKGLEELGGEVASLIKKGKQFKPGRKKGAWKDIKKYLFSLYLEYKPQSFLKFWSVIEKHVGQETDFGEMFIDEIEEEYGGIDSESEVLIHYKDSRGRFDKITKKQVRNYFTEYRKYQS